MSMRRSRAREVAIQVLYQDDLNPRNNPADGPMSSSAPAAARTTGRRLPASWWPACGSIAPSWTSSLARRPTTGAWNAWRPPIATCCGWAAYEILYTDTPDRVAIDEAVELAKRFGSAQSAQFVNGILDQADARERTE